MTLNKQSWLILIYAVIALVENHAMFDRFCSGLHLQGRGQFPCDAPILEIHGNDFGWAADMTSLGTSPLLINDDGAVVFYRCAKWQIYFFIYFLN